MTLVVRHCVRYVFDKKVFQNHLNAILFNSFSIGTVIRNLFSHIEGLSKNTVLSSKEGKKIITVNVLCQLLK